jgi:hypothetical protein
LIFQTRLGVSGILERPKINKIKEPGAYRLGDTGYRCLFPVHISQNRAGQGMIEFALMLPVLILVVFGALELGRAFFAYIAITNAAREGARVYTFRPDVTTASDVAAAVTKEVGSVPLVNVSNIASIDMGCGNAFGISVAPKACPRFEPIRVTVTYNHNLVFNFIFPQTIVLRRSAEMMVP